MKMFLLISLMWLEIQHGITCDSVKVRIMDPEFRSQLYWLDRSDDCGITWKPYIQLYNGEWRYVGQIPRASMFRGRLTI